MNAELGGGCAPRGAGREALRESLPSLTTPRATTLWVAEAIMDIEGTVLAVA
jgi:hypothetical protein